MFIKKLRERLFNNHNVEEHNIEDNVNDSMKNNIEVVQNTDSINKDDGNTNTSTPDNLGSDSTNINNQNTDRQSMQYTDISLHIDQ